MSNIPRHRLIPAVQYIVLTVRDRYHEHFARLHAEAVEADAARLRGEPPAPSVRIVDHYKKYAPLVAEELLRQIRAGRIKAYEQCREGGFRELAPEFLSGPESNGVLEEPLFKPVGRPVRHPIFLDRSVAVELRRTELAEKTSPSFNPASSVRQKPLPTKMMADVIRLLELLPTVPRPEQAKAVRAKFREYRITDRILREAARSAPVPRGRPRDNTRRRGN
jgi:hypothetical protein